MALVPWKYSNPYVSSKVPTREFTFLGHSVRINQRVDTHVDAHQNTHQKLWDGSYYLASFICSSYFPPDFWKGKTCVELGCGTGLVGLVAWLCGARSTLTDCADSLERAHENVLTNAPRLVGECSHLTSDTISVEALDWCEPAECMPKCDIILGSEVVYLPELSAPLLNTIERLSNPHTQVFIVYKARGLGEHNFWELLKGKGVAVETVAPSFLPEDFLHSGYQILKFSVPAA